MRHRGSRGEPNGPEESEQSGRAGRAGGTGTGRAGRAGRRNRDRSGRSGRSEEPDGPEEPEQVGPAGPEIPKRAKQAGTGRNRKSPERKNAPGLIVTDRRGYNNSSDRGRTPGASPNHRTHPSSTGRILAPRPRASGSSRAHPAPPNTTQSNRRTPHSRTAEHLTAALPNRRTPPGPTPLTPCACSARARYRCAA